MQDREEVLLGYLGEFDDVGPGAEFTVFIEPEEPDEGLYEGDRRFDEEFTLFGDPIHIEAEKEGTGSFFGVVDVDKGRRVEEVAAMGIFGIVELDDVEAGVVVFEAEVFVVGEAGEVIVLEIMEDNGVVFLDCLTYPGYEDGGRLACSRGSEQDRASLWAYII